MKNNWKKKLVFIRSIKIIDILAALFFLFFLFFFFFQVKRTGKIIFIELLLIDQAQNFNGSFIPQEYWRVNTLLTGDSIFDDTNKVIGKVISTNNFPWGGGLRSYSLVTVELQTIQTEKTGRYLYQDIPIYVGADLKFKTSKSEFVGKVANIYESPDQKYVNYEKKTAIVTVKGRQYESWIVERLKDFSLKNSEGDILAEVLDLKIYPAQVSQGTADGRLVLAEHPFLKDFEVKMKLHDVKCLNTICYFNDFFTFMIGSEFWIDNGQIFIGYNTSIMSIEYQDE